MCVLFSAEKTFCLPVASIDTTKECVVLIQKVGITNYTTHTMSHYWYTVRVTNVAKCY